MSWNKSLLIFLLMLGSTVFANDWEIQEMPYEKYVYYVIKESPAEYENLIDSMVCSRQSRIAYRNVYLSSCKEEILEYLKNGDFEIGNNNNAKAAFLPVSFLQTYFPICLIPCFISLIIRERRIVVFPAPGTAIIPILFLLYSKTGF